MSNTGKTITRVYGGFRGVDFRGEEVNIMRSPDSLNMWKDYKETESIRTRPGLELYFSFSEKVYGVFFYKDEMIVHVGTELFSFVKEGDGYGSETYLYGGLNEAPSDCFIHEDIFYFKDGKNYLQYNGIGAAGPVIGYVPTTSIGREPKGGGEKHQEVNMMSPWRINTFVGDDESKEYVLDAKDISSGPLDYPQVKINDELIAYDQYTVDYEAGKITFKTAPPSPKTSGRTDGQDNVSIQFKVYVEDHYDRIAKCTLLEVFDNRVFFSGNPDYPNAVWHSSLDDPSYCSDLDYYKEGVDAAPVRGLVAGNNALWVFREPSQTQTSVFYHTPSIDEEEGKVYPSMHSSASVGCVGKAINFNDDIVFFSDRGMEGISGDITTEQVVSHRSSLVDRKLVSEDKYRDMILAEWEGYLLVFVGTRVYLADSRSMFNNENHVEYDWFYWDLGREVTCAKVYDGVLYVGSEVGVFTFEDLDSAVESYWVTPKDKFNNPNMQKTTNKRGCVAEVTGDVAVYAKTDKTDEFELVGAFENVEDYCVSRIKKKKFKDIQLKFHSDTRFSLETATLECFVGGYIKR